MSGPQRKCTPAASYKKRWKSSAVARQEHHNKKKRTARLKSAVRLIGGVLASALIGSVLWAGSYRFVAPPTTLTMVARSFDGEKVHHPWVSLSEISPHLLVSVIAAEDTRFCHHRGIDWQEIRAALREADAGKPLRGASTISQQTAKNAFLWNGGGWVRKAGEAWMTLLIEFMWPKERILEVYLNIAEWGDGHFGAEAAARARFGKAAINLSAREAALLASVLPNPHKWRVDPPGPYIRQRAGTVAARAEILRRDQLTACVN